VSSAVYSGCGDTVWRLPVEHTRRRQGQGGSHLAAPGFQAGRVEIGRRKVFFGLMDAWALGLGLVFGVSGHPRVYVILV
jgi:hypothetical protein